MQLADKASSLSYLRLLHSSRSELSSLVDDLKAIQYKGIHGVEQIGSISATLDQSLDDLFVPNLENGRYIEREVKSLQELYSSFLYKFNGYHVKTPKMIAIDISHRGNLRGTKCLIVSQIRFNPVLTHRLTL